MSHYCHRFSQIQDIDTPCEQQCPRCEYCEETHNPIGKMEDELIKFETAKLAHQKNCDLFSGNMAGFTMNKPEIVNMITQSLLKKWLREIHGIHINVDFGLQWGYQLIPVGWYGEMFSQEFIDGKEWSRYEDALEEGLIEGLKLIELKKS